MATAIESVTSNSEYVETYFTIEALFLYVCTM